ncbi:hypothetical protein ACFQU1_15560 [Chelatococcus sp. GCM10030263]|uniref:hypothetical protein n=1 Tax=Chelatococcus sp. GCM10030263 TaxID=3273387 RepID=UPI00361C4A25
MTGAGIRKSSAGIGRLAGAIMLAAGGSVVAGIAPAAAQFFDRPPGFFQPLPPEPIPEAPPPWARGWRAAPPPPDVYGDELMPPEAVVRMVERRGFAVEGPLRRRGDVYIVHAVDGRGDLTRLMVDAFDGTIVSRRVLASASRDWEEEEELDGPPPLARLEPGPESRYRERFAAREPAQLPEPRVIPAPPMPKIAVTPKVPHPPVRPRGLATGTEPSVKPADTPAPVAQATPAPAPSVPRAEPAQPQRPGDVDIAPPDLPEVGPPSF